MNITQANQLKEAHAIAEQLRRRVEALEQAYNELVQKLNDKPKRGRPPNAH